MTKIFIKTYGCSMNQADSESMAALLKGEGHQLVTSIEEADTVLYNTCTVKDPTQSKFFDEMRLVKKTKKVVIAGCIAQAQPELFLNENLVGVEQLHKITEAIAESNVQLKFLDRNKEERLELPSIRTNSIIEIIPVNKGCTGYCSYCKTKAARGGLKSFPLRQIVSRARKAISEGVKEIWITSQDTGAYGTDIDSSLPELVQKVADNKGSFRIRIGMTNPEFVLKYEKELITVLRHKNVYKFLHVPVQSGNNEVLKAMIRPYNIDEVKVSLLRIKSAIPNITFSTDIICGFPGETELQWEQTMEFVKKINFPIVNISKYYARPGTRAARMKQLSSKVKKARSTEIYEWLTSNDKSEEIGKQYEVLINEQGKNNQLIGKSENYLQVILNEGKLGDIVKVKVVEAAPFYLIGQTLPQK